MLEACREGKIDRIITKSSSRFARNTMDSISILRELKALDVSVFFEKEGINTMEESSELFLTIMSSLAQEELNSLSLNVKMGLCMAMKRGVVHYSYKGFYGYEKGENKLPKIIPEEAVVVQKIFETYLGGASIPQVQKTLKSEEILYRKGKAWTENHIRSILFNEKYCGDVILQKTFLADPISKKTKVNNGDFLNITSKTATMAL